MWRFFCKKNFSSPWCCCVRHKDNEDDKLQSKARTRLYKELDILTILQNLRVSRYHCSLGLSEEQRYLVNYHGDYMLFRNDEITKAFDAARYTDHRGDEDANFDARRKKTVSECIESLRFDKEADKQTYIRIMSRDRPQEDMRVNLQGEESDASGSPAQQRARQN